MLSVHAVALHLESLNLSSKKDAVVLLFKHGTNFPDVHEPRFTVDLQEKLPGLLKVIKVCHAKSSLEAVLLFRTMNIAAKAVVNFWELRLKGLHALTPQIVEDDSDCGAFADYIDKELKNIFLHRLDELENGEPVQKCRADIDKCREELFSVQKKLKRNNPISVFEQLTVELRNSQQQVRVLGEQLEEYLNALNSLRVAIYSRSSEKRELDASSDCRSERLLLSLGDEWSWHHLHYIIERETWRFKERLPLYGKRSGILRNIKANQVLVLSGETGSGKSTQLVQYIVDAGFIEDGSSVVCTQPRKVAAMTLFERVTKESRGCSTHDPLVGSLMCASERTDRFPKIMFMTDHALLQLCLVDELLNWFQCVIVDEAHERTLNTDLLLAMLKRCLDKRSDFKVIIMSATADGELLASYFGACAMYHVAGRNFPVEVIYETEEEDGQITDGNYHYWGHGRHVSKAVQKVKSIISESEKGDVLAFLTSQAEIEWACSQEYGPNILILPLHGRLQASEQQLVFKAAHDGMRKVVFATNIAETSLTIPGIKFVVDCGLVKESCVDPNNGMTILKICQIDKGAAMQRTGRAGRTEAGICYRLYKRDTFEAMLPHRIPEILRVHLGIAVLKLTALGVQKIETFDFIDSPSQQAICLAVENLTQLGAIRMKEDKLCLTPLGRKIAKLGVDPCLGYIVLKSLSEGLGKEGAVIAGLLSCSSFIFFRAGSEEEKLRSDCLKMRFCQPDGDIFTLLSVYQEWSSIPLSMRNKWCLQNSINVKSMRRCHDFIKDLKCSLRTELNTELPSQWTWYAGGTSCHLSVMLRKILLSSMPNNVAVFSGHDSTGYDVVITGKQAYLHPSSSCLVFGQYPTWIVFANLLCTSRAFLTLSIAVEPEWLSEINGALYDVAFLEARRMHKVIISDISRPLLMRICGKFNKSLKLLTEKIIHGSNQRCCLEADHEKRTISIYATLDLLGRARQLVDGAIEQERKWLNSFCVEKPIFQAFPGRSSPVILFGAGAVIKEVLMPGEFVRVEISNVDTFVEDQEVLNLFDMCSEGVAGFYRNNSPENNGKWGTITFNSQRGAAEAVSMLQDCKIGTFNVKVKPFVIFNPHDGCRNFFPVLRATLSWPRRQSSGHAVIRCKTEWGTWGVRGVRGRESWEVFFSSFFYMQEQKKKRSDLWFGGTLHFLAGDTQRNLLGESTTGCVQHREFFWIFWWEWAGRGIEQQKKSAWLLPRGHGAGAHPFGAAGKFF